MHSKLKRIELLLKLGQQKRKTGWDISATASTAQLPAESLAEASPCQPGLQKSGEYHVWADDRQKK
jgi:hypothetical protein